MKTREELNALKAEVENLNRKLAELTEDELIVVSGGRGNHECEYGKFVPDTEPPEASTSTTIFVESRIR